MTLEQCDGECKKCLLQGPDLKGYLKKIVSTMRNGGIIADRAGEIWLQRGGAVSSREAQEDDFRRAQKEIAQEICEEIRNGPNREGFDSLSKSEVLIAELIEG